MKRNVLTVSEMTCSGCERKIERILKGMKGISQVKVSYVKGTVEVAYDEHVIALKEIKEILSDLDYEVIASEQGTGSLAEDEPPSAKKIGSIVLMMLGAYLFIGNFFGVDLFNSFPVAEEGMSYAAIFFIGLFTSIHCIAMCGGINLSQCINRGVSCSQGQKRQLMPSILYNSGRVVGYTMVGGIVGAVGSVVTLSGSAKGMFTMLAGVFMIIMGLNMLNIFPWLRRFNLTMPRFITNGLNHNDSPFYVGLFNALMPCGPLQAMQLYALSTGSPVKGAFAMFLFSIGTVPLMFGFGAISSLLSKKFTKNMMLASAVLVMMLGVSMFNNGMALSGFSGIGSIFVGSTEEAAHVEIIDGVQHVYTEVGARSYPAIKVQKDMPVRWVLYADDWVINSCNNFLIIPEYEYAIPLMPGENIVEFTPTETGTFPYSCWMGMIRSTITVVN